MALRNDKMYFIILLLTLVFAALGQDSSEVNHTKMSPTLIVLLSCLCFFTEGKIGYGQQVERQKYRKLKTSSEQAKESQTNKVRHRNKWWLIETTSKGFKPFEKKIFNLRIQIHKYNLLKYTNTF